MHFRLNFFVFSLLCSFASLAFAGENDEPSLQLDNTPINVQGNSPGKNEEATPIFISAQQMEGKKDGQIEAVGDVELRKRGQTIDADRMLYIQDSKDISADGSVRIAQDNNLIEGPHLKYNLDTGIGDMTQPAFYLGDTHAHGSADTLHLADRHDFILRDVSYTTCPADQDDWLLKVRELEIDQNNQLGIAHGALVEFKGEPILYAPWMDFPLNGQRKSGFLGPVFGSTVSGGSEITVPYYWNIAPNLDATLSPRIIAKRGTMFSNEVRYLEPTYSGVVNVDVLPDDRLTGTTRSLFTLNHLESFGNGLNGLINFNRVSDDAYFRDLSNSVNVTSQTTLLRQGVLSYSGGWWNASAAVQSFQTLQDPSAPVTPSYNTLPQVSVDAQRLIGNETVTFTGQFSDFHHPTLVNGQRLVLYPSVSYPLIAESAFYLTPKIGLHYTDYTMGSNNTSNLPNASRTLPIVSVDSGLTMERDWSLGGQFLQTLEPRAFFVYIPYRDQSQLPDFDSDQTNFSFAQMFNENRFLGNDRIGDAHQVTLALTSRLLEPDSGAERLRVAIGQRFSTSTPKVNLPEAVTPGVPPETPSTKSDVVLDAAGQLTRAWSLAGTYQFTPNQSQTQQLDASARYQPEIGKVINLGYRFTRNSLRQMDLSTQWPLAGKWHVVGRWNYSIQDGLVLEALGGLEYNQNCWAVRIVAQRFATATQQVATGVFIQLELNDLVAVGSDPLGMLRQNIFGYSKINAQSNGQPMQDFP
ncbi:MAG: LPS-assembly protein LptD, partial [Nitrosomonadales bacterium]